MRDVKRSLQVLDQLDPPELWSEAQRRPAPPLEEARHDVGRRVAVIVTAFALTAAATAYAISAFRTEPAPPPVAPVVPDTRGTLTLPESQVAGAIEAGGDAVWAGVSDTHSKRHQLLHIEPGSMQIRASITTDVPAWREHLVVTTDAVWIAEGDTIQRIDPATDQVVDTIELTGLGISALAGDDDALWAAATDNRFDAGVPNVAVLVRIDPATDAEVARIPMDGYVNGYGDQIRLSADSVWVLGERLISDSAERGGTLARVDPATDTVVETYDVAGFDMAVTDTAVWVRSAADGVFDSGDEVWNLVKVDPAMGTVGDPRPLDDWVILGATDASLWLTRTGVNSGDLVIEEIDVASGEVTFRGRVPGLGELLTDLSFDVRTRTLWTSGMARIERIPLDSIPNEITPKGAALVLDVVGGADGPEASITWGEASMAGVRGEYKWCDGSGGCESGIPNWSGQPPTVAFLPVPMGTPLMITGDVTTLKGGFFEEGGHTVSRIMSEAPGAVPDARGRYYLEIHVALDGEGSARGTATFWLGVEAVPGPSSTPSPSTPPSTSGFQDLVGPSWQLSAIDDVPLPADAALIALMFSPDRISGTDGCDDLSATYVSTGGLGSARGALSVNPIESALVACDVASDERRGTRFFNMLQLAEAFQIEGDTLSIRSTLGSLTFIAPLALDCPLVRGGTSIGGQRGDYADDEAAIRALLSGVRGGDVFEPFSFGGPEHALKIARDGSRIAWARVGPGPDGAVRVEFDACDGSGISATYPSA